VLDLGSGHGGGSHAMAQKFGCKVTGYNLGAGQNAMNMERCKELGIDHLVDAQVGNINEPLPVEWTGKFDFVWSCEVLCHAGDKVALFKAGAVIWTILYGPLPGVRSAACSILPYMGHSRVSDRLHGASYWLSSIGVLYRTLYSSCHSRVSLDWLLDHTGCCDCKITRCSDCEITR
jgi:SAM-dependent methyltransferase